MSLLGFAAVASLTLLLSSSEPEPAPSLDFTSPTAVAGGVPADAAPEWLWRLEIGHGYSSPALRGGRVFASFHRDGNEGVAAFDLKTGRRLWEQTWKEDFDGGGYGPGPNAPLQWVGEHLLVTGVALKVVLVEPESGEVVWRRDLVAEEAATIPGHGYASAAYRFENTLLYGLGGKRPGPIVALDVATGRTLWTRGRLLVGYATPGRFVDPEGRRSEQVVFYTRRATVGVDPSDGDELWRLEHPSVPTWNASLTPRQVGPDLLFTGTRSDTHNGSRGIRVTREGDRYVAREAWFRDDLAIEPMNHVVPSPRGVLATVRGGRSGPLVEIDAMTGEPRELVPRVGDSSLVSAGRTLIALDERGGLSAFDPLAGSPDARRLWTFDTESKRSWAMPLVDGDLVVLRTRSRLGVLDLQP